MIYILMRKHDLQLILRLQLEIKSAYIMLRQLLARIHRKK